MAYVRLLCGIKVLLIFVRNVVQKMSFSHLKLFHCNFIYVTDSLTEVNFMFQKK